MNCEQVLKSDIVEKYILSQLSVAEHEAFEQHYFECERCFEELQTCRALQVALNETGPVMHTDQVEEPLRWMWTWGVAAVALVLLTIGFMLWSRRPALGPSPPVAVTTPPRREPADTQLHARSDAQASTAQSTVPTLSQLAQFQPPHYVPSILRGAEDEANGKFREAMKYYERGEYASSIPILIVASQVDSKAANISFFLGICYLETGHTDAAIEALRKTEALGDSPYLEETHFYLAKALIRKGDVNGARKELRETIQLRGDIEEKAQRLLGQLQVAGRDRH